MGDDNTKSEGEVAGATAAEDRKNGSKEGEPTNDNDANPENATTDSSSGDAATATEGGVGDTSSPEEKDEKIGDSAKDDSKQDTTTSSNTEAITSEGTPSKSDGAENKKAGDASATNANAPVVSSSKKSRPPYKYDPDKITLRFLFANRDGLTVTVECRPGDTVGEVKGALLSVWPTGT